MKLSLLAFDDIVANSAAALQAATSEVIDVSVGSVFRALLEANASICLWIQWLIVCVLRATRASTSAGADLDSWMDDFGFTRLPPSCAVGNVIFSRYNATSIATVLAGTLVKTSDNTQTFIVTIDETNLAWSTAANGYLLPSGVISVEVPVVAQSAGTIGNVLAGHITVLSSPITGVDLVTNPLATTNGLDGESDSALRQRFVLFINSRSRATLFAIQSAIIGVQQGLLYNIAENTDTTNCSCPGSFVVTVDDGSGYPSASLVTAVSNAIEAVRPVGSIFSVRTPAVQSATVSLAIDLTASASRAAVLAAVESSITSYINGLPIGAPLRITRIAQIVYDADPAIINVTGLTLNGAFTDLSVSIFEVLKVGSLSVT